MSFLDVETSLTARRWMGPTAEQDRAALALAQHHPLPPLLASVLARLDVEPGDVAGYLSPTLRALMPDPDTLRDMPKAADLLASAVQRKERIAIFADYDVDGGASAALLSSWLGAFGIQATLYVPDRLTEGYGPNVPAMDRLGAAHDLVVCVDCGTLSHEPVAAAVARGARVMVLDHHLGGETLPDAAAAVVNPNRQDEDTPLGYLCAGGVVFLLLVAANRALRARGVSGPDLLPFLDLVALATVADVAPLQGLNRAFVRQGLKVMGQRNRVGLTALADVAGLTSAPSAYHLGYLLGPRINAGGRIGKADMGARLLSTHDPSRAAAMAEELDRLNRERRDIEATVLDAAMQQAEERGFDAPLVWAAGEGWHPGVVGIVAARLKEAANRPAVVIGIDAGTGKGSGRSVAGIDLGAAIATCTREGLFTKGGGHKMAAGLTVDAHAIPDAMDRLAALLQRQGAHLLGPRDVRLDGALSVAGASIDLVEQLEMAGPFGAGVSAPRVAIPSVRIDYAKRAGTNHLSLALRDGTAGRLQAIAFGAFDTPLGPALEAHNGALFHVAGRLEIDDWGGRRKVKLRIEDAARA